MRYLNTAYVRSHRARVGLQRGALLVSSPDGCQRVPLEAVDAVVLLGAGQITTQALEACVRRGVRVSALRRGGGVRFVVGQPTGGNVHLRMAQYRAVTEPAVSLGLSKSIVAAKLQNSRKVIGRWARDEKEASVAVSLAARSESLRSRVSTLEELLTADQVRGVEGDGARVFFFGMREALSRSELRFAGRNRRPPRDPVNALLGFCYGLLVTEVIGAAETVGLDYTGLVRGDRP